MMRTIPPWIVALAVILVLQTMTSYLTRLVPIASPAFMSEFGWDDSWIGYLSAANIVGALFILLAGVGLVRRMGSVLALAGSMPARDRNPLRGSPLRRALGRAPSGGSMPPSTHCKRERIRTRPRPGDRDRT